MCSSFNHMRCFNFSNWEHSILITVDVENHFGLPVVFPIQDLVDCPFHIKRIGMLPVMVNKKFLSFCGYSQLIVVESFCEFVGACRKNFIELKFSHDPHPCR